MRLTLEIENSKIKSVFISAEVDYTQDVDVNQILGDICKMPVDTRIIGSLFGSN